MMVGAYIKVAGMVQGVGFRYFAMRHANELGLTGYVKNKADGSVELQIEGAKQVVDNFKSILEQGPGYSSVDKVEITYEPYTAKYNRFYVEY
jgi:acylphosphatase